MALPKLLDDLVTKRIVEAVRGGASRTAAAEAARVARSTLHLWLQRGGAGEEPYASFTARVREAEGELEKELVTTIKNHSVNTWQAAAWMLERKFQKRWALRRDQQDRATPLTPEEQDRLIAEAAKLHAETIKQEKKS
jgi:transposase